VKFREPFRPFAPSVRSECAETLFDLPGARDRYPARFMLYVVPVRENWRSTLPAVTHVDGSARPHVVHEARQPLYHRLLSRFEEHTGAPALLNTSFNLRGEPIVASASDALSTFERSGLDTLVIGDCVVEKRR
jgi:predicted NodU family carbamoyl transferase